MTARSRAHDSREKRDEHAAAMSAADDAKEVDKTVDKRYAGELPQQRRNAWTFKYSEDVSDTIRDLHVEPTRHVNSVSPVYRDLQQMPTDSWETRSSVRFAIDNVIIPRWKDLQQLGRTLIIFKVHKDPAVCELFFMPLEEVVQVYKGRFPKCVEWVTLYDPRYEIVFWAELFRPRLGGGKKSMLTDELCGGAGSRITIMSRVDREAAIEHVAQAAQTPTQEEAAQAVAEKQAKLDQKKKKKERQKQKREADKAAAEEEERTLAEAAEIEAVAAMRATRMPAPMLQGFDFKKMQPKAGTQPSPAEAPELQ